MSDWSVITGDCREAMAEMDAESVDSIVTDPPYGLSFMGKEWDHGVPGVEFWAEALRVAKPGAHLLAFGGTRMVHRIAVAIEDAGWEIRDRIHWVYGSGFPKSHDVSKAIDRRGGTIAGFERFRDAVKAAMIASGVSRRELETALGNYMLSHYLTAGSQPAVPNYRDYVIIRDTVGLGETFDHLFSEKAEREVVGSRIVPVGHSFAGDVYGGDSSSRQYNDTAPATEPAQQWHGWGTALKPAVEPIILARKPFKGAVAANVLEHGTGAINVDGCRVGDTVETWPSSRNYSSKGMYRPGSTLAIDAETQSTGPVPAGRWPANLIHDGSDEATAGMGGAARYFYCPKASKKDRGEDNNHPTVKPTDLMVYLCRLITPPGGLVLDPFNGSGSTGKAAIREGFRYVGIEQDPEYADIARERIAAEAEEAAQCLIG